MVPGLGEKLAQKLLQKFKSVKRIKQATQNELAGVVGETRAGELIKYFTQVNEKQ
jgi:excinuclease ABC subunit C